MKVIEIKRESPECDIQIGKANPYFIHEGNFDDREPRGCLTVKRGWVGRILKAIAWIAVAYVTIYSIASIAFNAAMLPIADMINKAVPDISTLGVSDEL